MELFNQKMKSLEIDDWIFSDLTNPIIHRRIDFCLEVLRYIAK
jgi:hypothetical protein